jgi:uncharacterized membrane protein
MNNNWLKAIIVILAISLISSVYYYYNQIDYLQAYIKGKEARIENLELEVGSLKVQLKEQTSYFVLAYASWIYIPRNESQSFDIIVQSLGYEGDIELSVSNLPEHVMYSFSKPILHISREIDDYSILTLTIKSNAKSGNYILVIEGKAASTLRFDLVTLSVPF